MGKTCSLFLSDKNQFSWILLGTNGQTAFIAHAQLKRLAWRHVTASFLLVAVRSRLFSGRRYREPRESTESGMCSNSIYVHIFFRVSFFSTVWTTTIDFGGESTTFAPSVLVKAWTIPARSNLCILIFHLLFRSIQRQQQPQNPIKKYKLIDRIL